MCDAKTEDGDIQERKGTDNISNNDIDIVEPPGKKCTTDLDMKFPNSHLEDGEISEEICKKKENIEKRFKKSSDMGSTSKEQNKDKSYESRRKNSENQRRRRRSQSYSRSPSKSRDSKYDGRRNERYKEKENRIGKDGNPVVPERQRRTVDILTSKTGGAYIPPAKLRMMQASITDKSSVAYQRIAWEALKKSIHGFINKINVDNIGLITRELLGENIVRGRGLLTRSIIQSQAASPTFTHVYAALVSVINSKFPNIGELLLQRLVIQFRRGFGRNDKSICLSASRFIAHLVNQRVAHEILALEILTLLVENPTDDSVEVAIAFLKECGQKLTEVSVKGINAIFEMLKNILHEGKLDKRVQYMIEVVFQVRKDAFKDHPSVVENLELVEEDDQFTHLITLDDATDTQDKLNVFKFDEKYIENEDKYKSLSKELLGSDASNSDESSSGGSDDDSDNDEAEEEEEKKDQGIIIDNTETNLIALRRTIYLTIHSSLDYEECAHKLMKMDLKPGQEMELCHMFLDCCAEQRTYEKFYGLLAQRFCMINKIYIPPFEEIFKDTYSTTHRLDTNRLRNVSKFFGHLLFTDAIGWDVFDCIKLNEDDTTSSSRIFIKILFQELAEYMGLGKLNGRLKDSTLAEFFSGLFPRDNPKNTRFAINFFTSIGLGGLTDELREHLKTASKTIPQMITNATLINNSTDSSSTSSSSSSSTSSSSSSDSSSSSSDDNTRIKTNKNKTSSKKKNEKKCDKSKKLDKNKASKRKQDSKDRSSKRKHDSKDGRSNRKNISTKKVKLANDNYDDERKQDRSNKIQNYRRDDRSKSLNRFENYGNDDYKNRNRRGQETNSRARSNEDERSDNKRKYREKDDKHQYKKSVRG